VVLLNLLHHVFPEELFLSRVLLSLELGGPSGKRSSLPIEKPCISAIACV
jgi:hypothetical protein